MSDMELKPCPFCGNTEPTIVRPEKWLEAVYCDNCGASSSGCSTKGVTEDLWNTRTGCEPSDKAMHIAARIWCDPQMEEYIMDVGLAHEIACMIESRVITPKET